MQTTHTHFNQSDSQEMRIGSQNMPEKEPMASTAIVIIIVAALAIAVVGFASAYYSAHYKNTDTEEGMASDTNNAPSTMAPEPGASGNNASTDTNTNPNASNDNSNTDAPAATNAAR